jgi:Chaperone of endosialidase
MATSGGGSQSTSQTFLTPQQKKLLGLAVPVASSYIGPGGDVKAKAYPGATAAPVDPYAIEGQKMALGYAMGPQADAAQSSLAGSSFLTGGKVLDARTNPYLQSAISAGIRPITENFQNSVLGNIRDNAQLAGQYGYNRQGLEESAANRDYMKQVADTSSQMASTNYQSGLQAMTNALGTEPGVMQASGIPGQTVNAVGLQRQQLAQQQIDAAIQQYYQKQFLPLSIASQLASLAMGLPGAGSVTSGSASQTASPFQMITGLGSMALGAGGMLAGSDRRLKDKIEPVENALGIIEQLDGVYYTPKDSGQRRQMGLIAQDVQKVLPEVVLEFGRGSDPYLAIAYHNLVGLLVNAVKELSAKVAALEEK